MDTPVPIPNTEVKHRSGEGIPLGENSELPGFFFALYVYLFVLHISQYVLQYCVITIERKDYYEY